MLSGLLGRKVGMTQVFGPNGIVIPVTVIEAGPCFVTQIKTTAHDGYEAVQLGFEQGAQISGSRIRRAVGGVFVHRLRLVGSIPGLDREVDVAVLAIDIDDHRTDLVAFLQVGADVLDPVAGQLRGTQIALDVSV